MKRYLIICIFAFFLILSIVFIIWNPFEKNKFSKKIDKIAVEYVQNELKETEVDSVIVYKIDSLTALKYARLTVELLENMYNGFQEELFNEEDEHKSDVISLQLSEIKSYIDEYNAQIENPETDDKKLLYYMITASYFKKGEEMPIIFLVTEDLKIYNYDIFNGE